MSKKFYTSLEGFRGIAVMMVLISHFIVIFHFPQLIFLKFGNLGVTFFFVLSGFLISEILIRDIDNKVSRKKILKNFYVRRVIRIFPIYYLAIILLSIFNIENIRDIIFWNLSYTYNIGRIWFDSDAHIISHFWSLCVEEQFYMIWPLLLIIFRKNRKILIFSIIIASILTKFLYVNFELINYGDFIHASTPAAMDALAVGALLAELKKNNVNILKKILKLFFIPFLFIIFYWLMLFIYNDTSRFYFIFGKITSSVTAFYLIGWGALNYDNLFTKFTKIKILRYLGKISYGIYVYHWIIYFLLIKHFDTIWMNIKGSLWKFGYNKWIFTFIIFTGLTIIIATISFYFIEKPLLKLKKRFV